MMKKPLFQGCATALVTPFFPDGSIDFESLGRLIDRQLAGGVAALIPCGTTGEAATLTERERLSVIEYTVWRVAKRVPVIAGTGTNCTAQSLDLTQKAAALGADGALAVCPYYNKPTAEGILAHYTVLAEESSLPVILYNVPSRTGCEIPLSVLCILARHPKVAGLKQANGSVASVAKIRRECGDDLPIYSGDDGLTLPILSLGGRGVISVVSNLLPHRMSELCNAFFEGKTAEAAEIQLSLAPLSEALFSVTNPIPAKAALEALGFPPQGLRLPLCPLSGKEKESLLALMHTYLQDTPHL